MLLNLRIEFTEHGPVPNMPTKRIKLQFVGPGPAVLVAKVADACTEYLYRLWSASVVCVLVLTVIEAKLHSKSCGSDGYLPSLVGCLGDLGQNITNSWSVIEMRAPSREHISSLRCAHSPG